MASDEETFGNLSNFTLNPSSLAGFTREHLDDLFPHTFNNSFAPSNEPIPEMEIELFPPTLNDSFAPSMEPNMAASFLPFNDSFTPSIEPIPEMIPQQTDITLDELLSTFIAPSIEPIPEMVRTEISSSLPEEVENINSGVVPSAMHGVEVKHLDEENKVQENVKSKRKYEVWTVEEHWLFLEGLKKYDKEITPKIWKKISEEFVVSKKPSQVCSHEQKLSKRQKIGVGKRLRPSINDITQYRCTGSESLWPSLLCAFIFLHSQ